jgi:thiol-disulfide isomerase/thioredoxin
MLARLALAVLLTTSMASAQHPEDAFVGQKAPELKGENVWINSSPLKLEDLRGKVVMLDFWAIDCQYCAETLPHIMKLHEKYSKQGLVIIGVHTPRMDHEKDVNKVRQAVARKRIPYPVVVDNNYQIWTDYLCSAWPSQYIIDQEGVIQLSHGGTERYEDMDQVVQKLLSNKKNGPQ